MEFECKNCEEMKGVLASFVQISRNPCTNRGCPASSISSSSQSQLDLLMPVSRSLYLVQEL